MRIAVVGQGYVGQAIGIASKRAGYEVFGIEKNQVRVDQLSQIGYPVSRDFSIVQNVEIVIIAVPTPLSEDLKPDLSFIEDACRSIKPFLNSRTLIINESTSFPGTLRKLIKPLLGDSHLYAVAPERIDPANNDWDIHNTPRVVGGLTEESKVLAAAFYKDIAEYVIEVSSPEVAEASKLLENTFRQVNIALINEFSTIINKLGIPATETIEAASSKPFGFMKFLPSIGVGGHCIPVDPIYLSYAASLAGENAQFIDLATKINQNRPREVAREINSKFNLRNKSIQVIGISYKANTDDMRESPVPKLIEEFRLIGASVIWHDPLVKSYKDEVSSPVLKVDLGVICSPHDGISLDFWKKNEVKVIDLSIYPEIGFGKFF
jgi:UDP-N-acetyl-D-glucosamine dehydrogenase